MITQPLDFEKPIFELEKRISELQHLSSVGEIDTAEEVEKLQARVKKLLTETFSRLTPWQIAQLSRHPDRPHTQDYFSLIFEDFIELHGDRCFRDDPSIVGGMAVLGGRSCIIIGHQKGRTTKENIQRNFGMPHPEGYRKAIRLMELAERFKKPLITFIDTPGAFPGIEAEERGQAEAIARSISTMTGLAAPIIVAIIGEGGSGGALALAVGDRVLMMEHATYSVISPEGCASILWRDGDRAEKAAPLLKMTAQELIQSQGIIDEIVKEPLGGAHRDSEGAAKLLKDALLKHMKELDGISIEELPKRRFERYRKIGPFTEKK